MVRIRHWARWILWSFQLRAFNPSASGANLTWLLAHLLGEPFRLWPPLQWRLGFWCTFEQPFVRDWVLFLRFVEPWLNPFCDTAWKECRSIKKSIFSISLQNENVEGTLAKSPKMQRSFPVAIQCKQMNYKQTSFEANMEKWSNCYLRYIVIGERTVNSDKLVKFVHSIRRMRYPIIGRRV